MGNSCSSSEQVTMTVNNTCYKMNGQQACDVRTVQNNKFQGISQFVSCAISALMVFLIMDRKKTFSKLVLGITVVCLLSGIFNFIAGTVQENQLVSDKPKC